MTPINLRSSPEPESGEHHHHHGKHARPRALTLELKGTTLRTTYSVITLMTLSGIAWLILHYFMYSQGEFGRETNPLEPWALRIHGAAAFAMLLLLGFLIPIHMRIGWYAKRNRRSGGSLVGINIILILTGYALYYFGGEDSRVWISTIHSVFGVILPIVVILHVIFALQAKSQKIQTTAKGRSRNRKKSSDPTDSDEFQ